MDRRFLGILAAIIVIFIVVFAISSHGGNNSNNSGNSNSQPTSHIEGQNKAGVTLVEYGDYECPVCEEYYQPLKQAVTPLLPQIHFQFRNLPLSGIHPSAYAAARAAEAAGLQGKYWQMHDKLYENQNQWIPPVGNPLPVFQQFASQLGLNASQFTSDYSSDKVNNAISADLAAFAKTGKEQATPTFFLNGKYLDNSSLIDPKTGTPTADKITAAIQSAISQKKNT